MQTETNAKRIYAEACGVVEKGVLDDLARFKSYETRNNKLWRRVIDIEKPFEEVVQYVVENPVRKGLVDDWQDWPYSKVVDQWW